MSSIKQLFLGGSSGAYQIERSLRFNSADSAYLNRTPASNGTKTTWTWSCWVKRSRLGTFEFPFSAGPSMVRSTIGFRDIDTFYVRQVNSSDVETTNLATTQVFRDVSAWYHFVVAYDNTQATSTNRVKIYVNGTQVTAFNTAVYPNQNETDVAFNSNLVHEIGRYAASPGDGTLAGYLTEMYFIDGSALTPSSFGETDTDTGVWKPKAYSGSYGTNGFYLKFADNSGTTSTTLGKDSSGNGNNWTPNNFSVTAGVGNDSLVDTPTPYGTDTGAGGEVRGNYATMNPMQTSSTYMTFANGNLQVADTTATGSYRSAYSTIFANSGKYYFESTVTSVSGFNAEVGAASPPPKYDSYIGETLTGYQGYSYLSDGNKYTNDTSSSFGNSYASGDVISVAIDIDAGKIWFAKNGTWQASGNPAAGTNPAFSITTGRSYGFAVGGTSSSTSVQHDCNFGQRPFAYTAPSGFKALCTQNLPTPTIGATATTRADDYFNTVLYTGNGTTQTISGVGFQPDFTWVKQRSSAGDNILTDAVRGATKILISNATLLEYTLSNTLTSFNSDGFSVGDNSGFNTNTATYVAWNWKANGAGSTNNAGSIQSTVSANTTAGFSIVTYTGNGTSGATVGHGLGVTPSMVILKRRDAVSNWQVKHVSLNANQNLELNSTAAVDTAPGSGYISAISSTTLTLLNGGSAITNVNGNTATYLAYCFAPIAGYSAFGKYTGNGSTDGPMVFTGFRPRFLLMKGDVARNWFIFDTARSTYNVLDTVIYPNDSVAESSGGYNAFDLLSNGFKVRSSDTNFNLNGTTYIYAAFAEVPTKFSLAR